MRGNASRVLVKCVLRAARERIKKAGSSVTRKQLTVRFLIKIYQDLFWRCLLSTIFHIKFLCWQVWRRGQTRASWGPQSNRNDWRRQQHYMELLKLLCHAMETLISSFTRTCENVIWLLRHDLSLDPDALLPSCLDSALWNRDSCRPPKSYTRSLSDGSSRWKHRDRLYRK